MSRIWIDRLNELFEKRDYCIRAARLEDIDRLLELESGWPEHLRMGREALLARLNLFPMGQLVLCQQQHIVAVVYSQRIASMELLRTAQLATLSQLHEPEGAYLQLISLNVDPALQDQGFGDQLLNFVLQWGRLLPGIQGIAAITRCRDFKPDEMRYEDYVQMRDEQGYIPDAIPRFHQQHGAVIREIVYGYRPEDIENEGNGLLIEYPLQNVMSAVASSIITEKPSIENIEETLATGLKRILGSRSYLRKS